MTASLSYEIARDRDHCIHVHLLFCRLSVNKDLSAQEKKGPSHVSLDFIMFKLFKESLPFENKLQTEESGQ